MNFQPVYIDNSEGDRKQIQENRIRWAFSLYNVLKHRSFLERRLTMGLFDSLKKLGEAVEVLNEAANTASKTTIEDFGEPVYSLYTALELGDLHRRIDITDEEGNVKYYTKSSVIALTGKTEILDAAGNNIAHLEKKACQPPRKALYHHGRRQEFHTVQ